MAQVPAYRYAAKIIRWLDGDTVDVALDLGCEITVNTRLRLYGIDTPELHVPAQKAAAQKALDRVKTLAPEGGSVVISTFKDKEKYGRWLGVIHLDDSELDPNDVAMMLVREGLAKVYLGGTKEPW